MNHPKARGTLGRRNVRQTWRLGIARCGKWACGGGLGRAALRATDPRYVQMVHGPNARLTDVGALHEPALRERPTFNFQHPTFKEVSFES